VLLRAFSAQTQAAKKTGGFVKYGLPLLGFAGILSYGFD